MKQVILPAGTHRFSIAMRLYRLIEAAPPATRLAGRYWYDGAHGVCQSVAGWYAHRGVTLHTVAGILAALSPRMPWEAQEATAFDVVGALLDAPTPMDTGVIRAVNGKNIQHAWMIAHGADPLDVITGLKTRPFYLNIVGAAHGGDDHVPTLDQHQIRLSLPPELRTLQTLVDSIAKAGSRLAVAIRREMVIGHRVCAAWLRWSVKQVQGATWLHYKEANGIVGRGLHRRPAAAPVRHVVRSSFALAA